MGYIDRGQRIESRFSRRPVRMSGVVLTSDATLGVPGGGGGGGGPESAAVAAAVPARSTPIGRFVMEKSKNQGMRLPVPSISML